VKEETMGETKESIWSRLSWPQVAALGIVAFGGTLIAIFAPIPWATLPWEAIIGALLSTGGVVGLAMGGPTVRKKAEPPVRVASRPSADTTRRDGSAALEALGWVLAWALAAIVAWTCSGCGASAIRVQARAATIATVALEGVQRVTMAETHARLSACQDDACTVAVEADMAPIALAHDAARATLTGWVEALDVAAIAGDDGDVIAALITAATRWLSEWSTLARVLAAIGLDVPELPPFLLALAGGAS
jgi:hypothetical protein